MFKSSMMEAQIPLLELQDAQVLSFLNERKREISSIEVFREKGSLFGKVVL